jgi:hypothetical protein
MLTAWIEVVGVLGIVWMFGGSIYLWRKNKRQLEEERKLAHPSSGQADNSTVENIPLLEPNPKPKPKRICTAVSSSSSSQLPLYREQDEGSPPHYP